MFVNGCDHSYLGYCTVRFAPHNQLVAGLLPGAAAALAQGVVGAAGESFP